MSVACLAAIAGCTNSSSDQGAAAPELSSSAEATTAPATQLAPPNSTAPNVRASGSSAAPATSISIPPNLCAATDSAQNTADAYMGALSAGNEKEALACVYGRSVPVTTTRSLLGHTAETAVYLPKQGGSDGPAKFDYVGAGKSITVTVSRLADHHTWVTGVTVHTP